MIRKIICKIFGHKNVEYKAKYIGNFKNDDFLSKTGLYTNRKEDLKKKLIICTRCGSWEITDPNKK